MDSRNRAPLLRGQAFDYSPPTDERPCFFNILRPGAAFGFRASEVGPGAVAAGNISATQTLLLLLGLPPCSWSP